MFHLNIRSIPEHFIELTSYIDSLDIVKKTYCNIENMDETISRGINKLSH